MTTPSQPHELLKAPSRTRGMLWAVGTCAITTALAFPFAAHLHPANVIMLYLVGVMLVASRHERPAAVLVSVLSVVCFDFFFVEPRFSVTVADAQYLLTLAVMLAVSLLISSLTVRMRHQAHALVGMESERLRNALLAAISHDLRTPLTSLVASADVLAADARLPPQARDNARTLSQQSHRMIGLMNNLLDMARLQAGAVTLQRQWNALEEIVGAGLRLLQQALAGHRVEVSLPPALPLLRVDAVLLERVLCNLLENAAKYAPAGTTITVSAGLQQHAGLHEMWISVADQGPGFNPATVAHAFDKFTRGEHESSTPGVGLGLAICRAIIEAHQGRLWIDASPSSPSSASLGWGARVVFALPIESQPSLPDEPGTLPQAQ